MKGNSRFASTPGACLRHRGRNAQGGQAVAGSLTRDVPAAKQKMWISAHFFDADPSPWPGLPLRSRRP